MSNWYNIIKEGNSPKDRKISWEHHLSGQEEDNTDTEKIAPLVAVAAKVGQKVANQFTGKNKK